jgi:hypothetical protein
MYTLRVETEQIRLPDFIVRKLIGKMIQFIEVQDGFIMKTVTGNIQDARGILKDKKFSTERYFQLKQEEKAIEK